MRRSTAWTVFLITLAIFIVCFLIPIGMVISGGFVVDGHFTLKFLTGVFQNPIYAEGLRNSLMIAICTTCVVTLIAVPLAWLSNRYDFSGKKFMSALILVPMILPPFVGAIGFQQILGQYGALNSLFNLGPVDWLGGGRFVGVVLLQSLGLYPIMYLNVAAALATVDPAMEEAAENLAASRCR
jgi:iron(III) transport system permease protein